VARKVAALKFVQYRGVRHNAIRCDGDVVPSLQESKGSGLIVFILEIKTDAGTTMGTQ
jgi:hypothetical protein